MRDRIAVKAAELLDTLALPPRPVPPSLSSPFLAFPLEREGCRAGRCLARHCLAHRRSRRSRRFVRSMIRLTLGSGKSGNGSSPSSRSSSPWMKVRGLGGDHRATGTGQVMKSGKELLPIVGEEGASVSISVSVSAPESVSCCCGGTVAVLKSDELRPGTCNGIGIVGREENNFGVFILEKTLFGD